MSAEADPYRVLGIERGASLEDIRLTYRRLALRCHPDRRRDDPIAAEREFQRLTEAYRAILRMRGRRREAQRMRAVSPAEMARRATGPKSFIYAEDDPDTRSHLAAHPEARKLTLPRTNETAVFVGFWLLAVVISAAAVLVASRLFFRDTYLADTGARGLLLMLVTALGTYLVVLAATIAALLASRRVLWVVTQLGLLALRLLPGRSETKTLGHDEQTDASDGERGAS
ncbi:MAG: J domain-containing protein [Phycisphaerae bacterium]